MLEWCDLDEIASVISICVSLNVHIGYPQTTMMTSHWPLKRECGAAILSTLRLYIHYTYKVAPWWWTQFPENRAWSEERFHSSRWSRYLLKYQESIDSNNSNVAMEPLPNFAQSMRVLESWHLLNSVVIIYVESWKLIFHDISIQVPLNVIVTRMRCLVDINMTGDCCLSKKQLWKWEITKGRFVPINIKLCQLVGASVN